MVSLKTETLILNAQALLAQKVDVKHDYNRVYYFNTHHLHVLECRRNSNSELLKKPHTDIHINRTQKIQESPCRGGITL